MNIKVNDVGKIAMPIRADYCSIRLSLSNKHNSDWLMNEAVNCNRNFPLYPD
jgi:hypothetical protein